MSEEKVIGQVTASMAAVSLSGGPAEEAKVIIICSDGKEIYLDRATALESGYVMRLFNHWRHYNNYNRAKNNCNRVKIKLAMDEHLVNIPSDLVEKVFHYCYRHAHLHHQQHDLEAFNAQFFMDVDYSELCKLLKAAMRFKINCLWYRGANVLDKITGAEEGIGILYHYQDLCTLPF